MTIKNLPFYFFALLLAGCSNNKQPESGTGIRPDTTETATDSTAEQPDGSDCVFDTSTYKFTTEALFKYQQGIKFQWDTTIAGARVRLANGDSLSLHIGGCNHFGYHATLLTSVRLHDTAALLLKTQWLAKTFFAQGFESKVPELISKGHMVLLENPENPALFGYRFHDPDTTETNMILDGFYFQKQGNKTLIDLLVYVN